MRAVFQSTSALFALTLATAAAMAQDKISWQPNLETAQRVAAQTNRLVLIHFWAPWCRPCMRLEKEVFSKPETAAGLEANFVMVKLNADQAAGTARLYGVASLPSDVITTPDGRLISQAPSPPHATQYVSQLNQVAAGHRSLARKPASSGAEQTAPPATPAPGSGASYGTQNPAAAPPAGPQTASHPAAAGPSNDRYAEYFTEQQSGQQPGGQPYGQVMPAQAYSAVPSGQANANPVDPYAPAPAAPQQAAVDRYAAAPATGQAPVADRYATPPAAAQVPAADPYAAPPATAQPAAQAPPVDPYAAPPAVAQANPYAAAPASQPPAAGPYATPSTGQPPAAAPYAAQPPAAGPYAAQPPPAAAPYPSQPTTAGPTTGPAQPQTAAGQSPPGCPPAGLDGNCPVTLVERKRWVMGNPAYGAVHRGRTYLFLGPQEQEKFLADPDRYSPVLSGIDPVKAIDNQVAVPGKREFGVFGADGHIYLFADEAARTQFEQNEQHYATQALRANQTPQYQAMRPGPGQTAR